MIPLPRFLQPWHWLELMKCGIKSGRRSLTVFVSCLVYAKQRHFDHFKIASNPNIWIHICRCYLHHKVFTSCQKHFHHADESPNLYSRKMFSMTWWVPQSVCDMLIASYSAQSFQSWIYSIHRHPTKACYEKGKIFNELI